MSSPSLYETLMADPRRMFDIKCTHPTLGVMTVFMETYTQTTIRATVKNINTHIPNYYVCNDDADTNIKPETTIEMFYDALAVKLCITNEVLMTKKKSDEFEEQQRRDAKYQEQIAATQAFFDDNDGSYYTPVLK